MRYRPEWLSDGAEVLIAKLGANPALVYDVVVVGSGYGGAVAAARFAGAKKTDGTKLAVCVLERGNEYVVGSFPNRLAELPGYVRYTRYDDLGVKGRRDGLFDLRIGEDVSVVLASGLGGGSLINAAVAERATDALRNPAWPDAIRADPKRLADWYERAEKMLGVKQSTNAFTGYAKHREFKRFIQGLCDFQEFTGRDAAPGIRVDAARAARLAIWSDAAGQNDQGLDHQPCIGCGDCVTGCNFRAKNTLAMNYLPHAKRKGAHLYTGATVLYVEPADGSGGARWSVAFRLTSEKQPGRVPHPHRVRARHVVFAAGTLGSPEILMRSRARGLRLSRQLGKRFSGNGDMISARYDQKRKVNASAPEHAPFAERQVGPTITAIAHATTVTGERLAFEELAIPAALRRLFEETVTTAALPVKFARSDWSFHAPRAPDSAAVDPDAVDRTQVLAAFGDDGARGTLEMLNGWETSDWDGAITVAWPKAGEERVYDLQDRLLSIDSGAGGLYLRSPLWQPLPQELTAALSGPDAGGRVLTVHPLGGCPMGNNRDAGVVDDIGRVYDLESGTTTYPGLLVLDGSIVPCPLGTNPLLTIAALAERAVDRYAAAEGWNLGWAAKPTYARGEDLPPGPPRPDIRQPAEARTEIRFAERMKGPLRMPGGRRVSCELETEFDPFEPRTLLRSADHRVRIRNATLTARNPNLPGGEVSARISGDVYWLERGRTTVVGRFLRAFGTLLWTRFFADALDRLREEGLSGLLQARLGGILKLATHVGEIRYLRYELTTEGNLGDLLPAGTRLTGLKTFRYWCRGNPWRQLSEMPVTIALKGQSAQPAGTLTIDPLHLLRRYALQLQTVGQTDAPTALMDLASVALYMLRLIFKIHFWSFRLPEYERRDPQRAARRLPGDLPGLVRTAHTVHTPVELQAAPLALPITNYRREGVPPDRTKPPVVLFHGFGSSGVQFAFPRNGLPKQNLVMHLAAQGFDVWVPELRTSIGVPSSRSEWTLDEVAKNDIPAIVDFVLAETRVKQVDVVAHCIGSAMFCTAVLAGGLKAGAPDKSTGHAPSKVRSAVLLQVGPLVTLSEVNRFNAHLITFLRRYAEVDHVDSSIEHEDADWVDALVDRVLNTYPYPKAEARHHWLCPPWKRQTHIANCNRSAGVFGRLFDHANVDPAMLDALGDLLGHTNLKTFEQTLQYAFLRRLTDYDATNAYVTRENLRAYFHFPVRFLHGSRNAVFSHRTARRSFDLLREVNPESIVERQFLRRYGHLDPLIGRHADEDVFPRISCFLSEERRRAVEAARVELAQASLPPRPRARRPLIGPVLGWTRKVNGRWTARVWCRADDVHVDPSHVMTMVYVDGRPRPSTFLPHDLIQRRPPAFDLTGAPVAADLSGIETLAAVDVPVELDRGDAEIVVASTYDRSGRFGKKDEKLGAAQTIGLGVRMAAVRDAWRDRVARSQQAVHTVDPGYDTRFDSVLARKEALDALDERQTKLSFALASCRYAARIVDREAADFMFGRLRALVEKATPRPPALLLLVGDQIYADATAGTFDPKTRRERFHESYHEAWSAPNARAVLRQLPTYMMMDDHEVDDDWTRPQVDNQTRLWGVRAFRGYQWLHSPRNAPLRTDGCERYFYWFDAAGFPFFVCDTRSTRAPGAHIMERVQLAELKDWLTRNGKLRRHKFVVSPSLVVPFRKDARRSGPEYPDAYLRRSDGWEAFPASLRELLSLILEQRVRNVVFLCGDAHVSMASRIWFERNGQPLDLGTRCVVSSPLYAPFPFANSRAEEFADAGGLDLEGGWKMRYAVEGAMIEGDSFAVVHADADPAGPALQIAYHLRDKQGPIGPTLAGAPHA
jgi:choline dehydrogenase-like flavoprotein